MPRRWSRKTWIVLAGLLGVAVLAAGLVVDRRISDAQVQDASDELFLLMTLRQGALGSYFDTVRAELTFWSLSDDLREDLVRLREAWKKIPGDPRLSLQAGYIHDNPFDTDERRELTAVEDGSPYADAHRAIHSLARVFVSERGYYDFFLIDPAGNVIYSVEKESDFASSLQHGALRESGLAQVYRRALEAEAASGVVFSDLARYAPSGDAPALFGAVSVRAADGRPLGVLALQVPTERIQTIMQFTAGMGRSGETYLVGSDYLMRSDSRFSDVSTTLETYVKSMTVRRALEGKTGVAFTDDYRDIRVLSAYGAFSLDGIDWAVMAEIDREEVIESVAELRMSVPAFGLALYALAIISLWIFGNWDQTSSDLTDFDVSDPSPG